MKKFENRVPCPCPVLRYGLFGQLVKAFGEAHKGGLPGRKIPCLPKKFTMNRGEGTISTLKALKALIPGRRKGLSLALPK